MESSSASWLVFEEKRDASTRAGVVELPDEYANDATHATEYPKTLTRPAPGLDERAGEHDRRDILNGAAHAASNALPARTKQ